MPDEVLDPPAEELTDTTSVQGAAPAEAQIPADTQTPEPVADATPGAGSGPDVSSGIDPELVQLAESLGIPTSGADEKSIAKQVTLTYHRYLAELEREARTPRTEAQQPQTPAAAAKSTLELERLIAEHLPEAEIDPALAKRFGGLLGKVVEHFESKQASTRQEIEQAWQQRQQAIEGWISAQEVQRYTSEVDNFFDGLPDNQKQKFGSGPIAKISQFSPQYKARNEAVTLMWDMRDGYLRRQQNPPPIPVLMRQAVSALDPESALTTAKRQLAQAANNGKNRALSRPAAKTGKPLDPDTAAIAKVEEWAARVGAA